MCPEVCWNARANLCEECAPKLEEEIASAQAHAKANAATTQLNEKAMATDHTSQVDMSAESVLRAPDIAAAEHGLFCSKSGVAVGSAKFCPECGTPVQHKPQCGKCGFEPAATSSSVPKCGAKM